MIDVLEKYSKRLQYLYFNWLGYAFAWERGGGREMGRGGRVSMARKGECKNESEEERES